LQDGTKTTRTFNHLPSSIGAEEAEEIGVEHLLRDIKDNGIAPSPRSVCSHFSCSPCSPAVSDLSTNVTEQLNSLKSLHTHINSVIEYLEKVVDGRLPVNHQILYNLQDIFNLLPNLNIEDVVRSFSVKTNDQLLTIYLSSLIRSVIALHNLINNKLTNRDAELKEEKDEADKEKEKEKGKASTSAKEDASKDKDKDTKEKKVEKR